MSTQETATLNSSALRTQSGKKLRLRGDSLDAVGVVMSSLCAIHCAVLPFVLSLLPFSALGILADERAEWLLLGVAASFGVASLCLGFREHRSRRALGILSVGLVLLLSGRMLEQSAHHEEGHAHQEQHAHHAHEAHAHEGHEENEESHAMASTHVDEHKHQPFGLSVTLMVFGGLGLAAAHLVNRRLCISCRQCHSHGEPA